MSKKSRPSKWRKHSPVKWRIEHWHWKPTTSARQRRRCFELAHREIQKMRAAGHVVYGIGREGTGRP